MSESRWTSPVDVAAILAELKGDQEPPEPPFPMPPWCHACGCTLNVFFDDDDTQVCAGCTQRWLSEPTPPPPPRRPPRECPACGRTECYSVVDPRPLAYTYRHISPGGVAQMVAVIIEAEADAAIETARLTAISAGHPHPEMHAHEVACAVTRWFTDLVMSQQDHLIPQEGDAE